jgi:hypothetical protein
MATKNLKPPFYNKSLDDFFEFECENKTKANFMLNWIIDNFPDLRCELMYLVPMFKLNKKNICYLQYITIENVLELQLCFGKGNLIEDRFQLFKDGPKIYRAIILINTEEDFLNKLKYYINQSINLQ